MLLAGRHAIDTHHGKHYAMARNLALELRAAYDEALARYDVLVMPTTPIQASVIPGPDAPREEVIGRALEMIANTCVTDVTGHPGCNVPAGLVNGLPTGMMIIGRQLRRRHRAARRAHLRAGGRRVPGARSPRPPELAREPGPIPAGRARGLRARHVITTRASSCRSHDVRGSGGVTAWPSDDGPADLGRSGRRRVGPGRRGRIRLRRALLGGLARSVRGKRELAALGAVRPPPMGLDPAEIARIAAHEAHPDHLPPAVKHAAPTTRTHHSGGERATLATIADGWCADWNQL